MVVLKGLIYHLLHVSKEAKCYHFLLKMTVSMALCIAHPNMTLEIIWLSYAHVLQAGTWIIMTYFYAYFSSKFATSYQFKYIKQEAYISVHSHSRVL